MAKRRRRRRTQSKSYLRWAALAGVCVFAFLYYKPARTYLHTRGEVAARTQEVRQLQTEHRQLQRLVAASTSDAELAREARRLGLVKPGERLFIVKGIDRWLKQHAGASRRDG
jgi:cell division protein FtsB